MKKTLLLIFIFGALLMSVLYSGDVYENGELVEQHTKWKPIDRKDITRIEIDRGTDRKNIITRNGDLWFLSEPANAEADIDTVEGVLKGLEGLKIGSLVSSKKEKQAMFQVDDSGIKVSVFAKGEKKLVSFIIGKTTANFTHTYIRISGSEKTYRAKGFSKYQFDKDTKMWRDKHILKFNQAEADTITLQSVDSILVLKKAGEDWLIKKPEEHKADKGKVTTILNILSNFNATDFEDTKTLQETKLDIPDFQIIIEGAGIELGRLQAGTEESNNVFIKNAKKDQIFTIVKSRLTNLKKDITYFKAVEKPKIEVK